MSGYFEVKELRDLDGRAAEATRVAAELRRTARLWPCRITDFVRARAGRARIHHPLPEEPLVIPFIRVSRETSLEATCLIDHVAALFRYHEDDEDGWHRRATLRPYDRDGEALSVDLFGPEDFHWLLLLLGFVQGRHCEFERWQGRLIEFDQRLLHPREVP